MTPENTNPNRRSAKGRQKSKPEVSATAASAAAEVICRRFCRIHQQRRRTIVPVTCNNNKTMKKYYVYAGYYEIWITDRVLRRPLQYQGWHKCLDAAIRHAGQADPEAVCFDESIRREVLEHFAYCHDPLTDEPCPFAFFDGARYSIANGLTETTGEYFKHAGRYTPRGQDLWDIMQWLHYKTGEGLKKLFLLHGNKTYDELLPVLKAAHAA